MTDAPSATSTCGCCHGTAVRTPGVVENRPGLGEIAYRSGRYDDFRASMVAGLSRLARPALAGLRTRDADDPSIALVDAWAVACDVLTFYSERLAHESFLRTATERTSLQELGKLVAYRLDPGVAAETFLAFSLERPPAPPLLDPPDPGVVPPAVPGEVVLPEGLRVQSVPGPGEEPQTFETVTETTARPEWNALPVARTTPHLPVMNRVDAWLDGVGLNLSRGDAILFASSDLVNDRWDVRLLTAVEVDPVAGTTHVTWDYGLGSYQPYNQPADAPAAFVLRKRLSVFGHNAPVWKAMNQEFRDGYRAQFNPVPADGSDWPFFTAVTTSGSDTVVDVDGAHPDIVVGSWVVLSQDAGTFYRELYEVVGRAELSRSAYAVSGKVTRLTLRGESHGFGTPRDVTVMAVSEPLTVVEAPDDSPVTSATIVVDGDATGMAERRTLVLTGTTPGGTPQSAVVTLDSVAAAPGGRTTLVLTDGLSTPFDRSTAVVFGNVARATHGETVTQVLGSGEARRPFQSFAVTQGPLTFVPADTSTGAESTLEVRVDDVRWSELPSTYPSGPGDRVFVTRDEPDGSRSVVFGDGARGARPATGSNNVRARYRKGTGAAGNVRRDSLSQALDRPLGLKGVTNPVAATGGVDPEVEAHARGSIPLPVRTLGRAVSLLDYADFALAFSGIAKAVATVLPLSGGRTIVVTVADDAGDPPPERTVFRLTDALRGHGDPHVRVVVLPCRAVSFRLGLKVKVDPDREAELVLPAVEAALRAAYGPPARALGEPVHRSAVIAVAAAVVGVVAVDLDRLYRTGTPSLQERLVAAPAGVVAGQPVATELLALSASPLDWLQEMP
jgi:predicted phage baseplate assembly protein